MLKIFKLPFLLLRCKQGTATKKKLKLKKPNIKGYIHGFTLQIFHCGIKMPIPKTIISPTVSLLTKLHPILDAIMPEF